MKNTERYLGLTWVISLISAVLFFVLIAFLFTTSFMLNKGFPSPFLINNQYFFAYCLVVFFGSTFFLVKYKSLDSTNSKAGLLYSLLPIMGLVSFVPTVILFFILNFNQT